MNRSCYSDTLGGAVDEILKSARDLQVVLENEEELHDVLLEDHLAYGQQRRGDACIASLKGKPTRKYFHAVIYRLDSGSYEWLSYVL